MTLQTIIRPLVDHAHQLLWIKVALENVFPGPSTDIQDSFTWDCIKEAAKDLGTFLKPMLDMVSRYEVLKSRAIAYVDITIYLGHDANILFRCGLVLAS